VIVEAKLILLFLNVGINESNIFPISLMTHIILGYIQYGTRWVDVLPYIMWKKMGYPRLLRANVSIPLSKSEKI
jgi:hypothetical protein